MMAPTQEPTDALVEFVRKEMMTTGAGPAEALKAVVERFEQLGTRLSADQVGRAERALQAEVDRISVIHRVRPGLNRQNRPQWYLGPRNGDVHWPALEERLLANERMRDAVPVIDEESTAVVAGFDSPALPGFKTMGLVLGYIQSGKTANMTAVIAKAVDAGFRFVLILTGLTDALRTQTQERLDGDLVGLNPERWYPYTTRELDFDMGNAISFPLPKSQTNVAIVKKNAFVLRRIVDAFRRTSPAILQAMPVLVIDDECDQASLNSSRYRDEMTRINGQIRTLVRLLPRVCYVGYTATPFANVLVDPRVRPDTPDDLYPRDFIYPLGRPDAYFGPERLFGRELLAHEEGGGVDYLGLDMIRRVPDDEKPLLRPGARAHATFRMEVTASLRRAILYFLLVTAAREARGQRAEHSSMLVHTSVNTQPHESGREAIVAFLAEIAPKFAAGDAELERELGRIWTEECGAVPAADFDHRSIPLHEVRPLLPDVLGTVEVVVENSCSVERLNYTHVDEGGRMRGRRYIVVGGSVLSRGLTIEGLSVSFFLRSANQYDTLMQMGRWFGYRPGYEDLPRIWMDDQIRRSFRSLALVEAEIREDIGVYARLGITPLQFAPRIRQVPGMAITARNKRLAARECFVSYDGTHVQTFRFRHDDDDWLRENWEAGCGLVDAARADGIVARERQNHRIFGGVALDRVLAFMRAYRAHPDHADLDLIGKIVPYIEERAHAREDFRAWNVVVVGGPDENRRSREALGCLGTVPTVVRSRLDEEGDADIKALMSKGDVQIDQAEPTPDARGESWKSLIEKRADRRPLILLYPIDRTSPPMRLPKNGSPCRIPLDAVRDVLGLGIVFPSIAGDGGQPTRYFEAPLPEAEECEEVDEEVARVVGNP